MESDGIQQQIDLMRQHLRWGGDTFTLGPTMLATLIDESDSLTELHRFGAAFGMNQLLRILGDDHPRVSALFKLLDAEEMEEERYKVRFEKYVGCFWRRNGTWAWYPESLDGHVIESPETLVQMLYEKRCETGQPPD